jgi:sulfatase maturation enzyme AslB (radical SAM superfamily)
MSLKQSNNFHISSSNLHKLIIEASGFCNAKCPHCPRYTDDGFLHDYIPNKHLTVEALKNGLNPKALINLKMVAFIGATGDPMISPHVEDLIDFFNFVPTITVDTNGSLRNKTWWSKMARFTNLKVIWSIDGLQDTNHLYRIGTDYKKIQKNAAAFISAGGYAIWKCVIFKHNQHQIDEITQLAKTLGFKQVIFHRAFDYRFQELDSWPVMVEGKFMHNIVPSDFSMEELAARSVEFDSTSVDDLSQNALDNENILCPWLQNRTTHINVSGHVTPCCMMTHETTNDYIGKTILQDMVDGNFDNISLYHNDLDHIFENHFGKKFNDTLKNEDTMHPVCSKSCGNILQGLSKRFQGRRESVIKHETN